MIKTIFNKKLKQDLFKLSLLTLVTVIIWLGFITYKALTKSQVKPDVKKLILPLTPNLDLDTMEKVQSREIAPEADWGSLQPLPSVVLLVPEAATEATSSSL